MICRAVDFDKISVDEQTYMIILSAFNQLLIHYDESDVLFLECWTGSARNRCIDKNVIKKLRVLQQRLKELKDERNS